MSDKFYVAEGTTPPSRRPPVTEVGVIGWLKHNLFGSWVDTIVTIVVGFGLIVAIYSFFSWAITRAQWELIFSNMRVINLGSRFPIEEVWRAEIAAYLLIFLSMLSIGVWGQVTRGVTATIAVIALVILIVPIASSVVPEPTYYTFVTGSYQPRQAAFIAEKDQEFEFSIEPITTIQGFDVENLSGHFENNNQAANTSWDVFNETANQVRNEQTDLSVYDLSLAVQIWDKDGVVLATSDFSAGSSDPLTFTWKAPSSGWFVFTAVRDPESAGEDGLAWIAAENITPLQSTPGDTEKRQDKYGSPPEEVDCNGCAAVTYRTDMRFQGNRSIPQWFSLQLTPFLVSIRSFFFIALIAGVLGYWLGKIARVYTAPESEGMVLAEQRLRTIAAIWVVGYIGAIITNSLNAQPALQSIKDLMLICLALTLTAYALLEMVKGDARSVSRGVFLMWLIFVPVSLRFLSGYESSAALPKVSNDFYGGLLLTMILSAIPIIVSFPIGVGLALGRQSTLPVIRALCTIFIEVIRGVPLITLIFMGAYIVQFFAASLSEASLVVRMCVVLTVFTSAYLAEVIRGGLQVVPKGQLEAARALGLSEYQVTVQILMPQALRAVIPAIMGQSVSLFKDTSLMVIIPYYELTGSVVQILKDSQTGYLAFPREGYLYIGIVYFVISYVMAAVSRRIEKTGSGAMQRDRF